ncbi:hypothetical protein BJ875DRAFT_467170 [Amylocarpus encephaloides]|uniref:RlpA-like protein double-psi beta-barrel domain-containing protein n=1 Tax=Amylocarpus encephaloides TaxID=45428 RepID=A0A9P8C387_9HELO|nr:hypothetical protein BJ875DRAFT_467170 [Amylocarpus encephaloides]
MKINILSAILAFTALASAVPVDIADAGTANVTLIAAPQERGVATYYYQNGGTGSCGERWSDNDILCAVSPSRIRGRCGHPCRLSANGHTLWGRVVDTCVGCSPQHVDVSVRAFRILSNNNLGAGRINVDWRIK